MKIFSGLKRLVSFIKPDQQPAEKKPSFQTRSESRRSGKTSAAPWSSCLPLNFGERSSRSLSASTRHVRACLSQLWLTLANLSKRFRTTATSKTSEEVVARERQIVTEVLFLKNGNRQIESIDSIKLKVSRPCSLKNVFEKTVEHNYPCAKSPKKSAQAPFSEYEKFLVQGIVSGKGLFEFVSPRAHHRPAQSAEKPLISALQEKWRKKKGQADGLVLGGRFKVMSIHPEQPGTDDAHLACQLTVIDLQHPHADPRVIPLTQVGVHMTDDCLEAEQIVQAHHFLQAHQKSCAPLRNLPDGEPQSLPMILSQKGRGRGPTVIVYNEIVERINAGLITDTPSLDAALVDIIGEGRKVRIASDILHDRKPDLNGFVHSDDQLQELKMALQAHLADKIAADATNRAGATGMPAFN
jgi:hypothetical protein